MIKTTLKDSKKIWLESFSWRSTLKPISAEFYDLANQSFLVDRALLWYSIGCFQLKTEVLGESTFCFLFLLAGWDETDLNLSNVLPFWVIFSKRSNMKVNFTQQCSGFYLPQSLIVAFSGPHLWRQDRHTKTHKEGHRKQSKTRRDGRRQEKGQRAKTSRRGRKIDQGEADKTKNNTVLCLQHNTN